MVFVCMSVYVHMYICVYNNYKEKEGLNIRMRGNIKEVKENKGKGERNVIIY